MPEIRNPSGAGAANISLSGTPLIVRRTVDSTPQTLNTVLVSDDTLLFPIGASETWEVEAKLIVLGANATMDCKFGWLGPASCTALWGGDSIGQAAMGAFGPMTTGQTAAAGLLNIGTAISLGTANNVYSGITLRAFFTNSTNAGTVTLQWAQNTSDAGALLVAKNSRLMCWRLA